MDKSISNHSYRVEIDGIRAMAVLSVLAYHTFPLYLPGGFIGVDMFFVISGFLISRIILDEIHQNEFSFKTFYARRIKRIFPALTMVLIATLTFAYFALLPDELTSLSSHIIASSTFVSNFILMFETGYFDTSADTKPLLHLWSLSIEEQFYVFWPILLYIFWRVRHTVPLYISVALLMIISFYLNVMQVTKDVVVTFYNPSTRAWELLAGCLLACLFFYGKSQNRVAKFGIFNQSLLAKQTVLPNLLSAVGLSLLLYGFFRIHDSYFYPYYWALVPVIGTLLIIIAGNASWLNNTLLSNPLARWFGWISYPLYLWHWPIISFLWILESGKPSASFRILAILLSIVLAWITYAFIEKPIRRKSDNATIVKLLTLMVLICL